MRFAVLALLLAVPALAAQENEAEKLYRQLETKLTGAKAVRVVGDLEISRGAGGEPVQIKISLLQAGDKFRLEVRQKADPNRNADAVSNGETIRTKAGDGKSRDAAVPKGMGQTVTKLLSRVGLIAVELGTRGPKDGAALDADALLPVSDFKAGAAEKVGGRDAKVISFTVTATGPRKEGDPAKVTLWLDAKTLLPLKHVITPGKGQFTATYSAFEIDPKVDPKGFELPK